MSRHAKNCTASSYFTYAEKQKLNYGTQRQRLGKDSLRNFDCCCLTLVIPMDPVITPQGFLYEREAIYESLLQQQQEIKRKLRAWKDQKKKREAESATQKRRDKQEQQDKFEKVEGSIGTASLFAESNQKKQKPTLYEQNVVKNVKTLRSFWVPELAPKVEEILQKPSTKTVCPESGKPLRVKHLMPIEFVPLRKSEASRTNRWMCPICFSPLSNKTQAAVLKTSRKVVCYRCIQEFVLKTADKAGFMKDPLTAKPCTKRDIIKLQGGGTGYAGKQGQQNLMVIKEDIAFVG
eukprot:TRINITY_DN8735_c0_g1_i1.p1 TRINITY_DN8735_c0_g1~~TRINITY_DN8735_c0_g1_i1.p1  ORF type:complete len:292 (+),score=51.43 TRINITY_DN8735_c0_g1_i1:80-955(+)